MQGKGVIQKKRVIKNLDLTGFQEAMGQSNCPRLIWLTTGMALERGRTLTPHRQISKQANKKQQQSFLYNEV